MIGSLRQRGQSNWKTSVKSQSVEVDRWRVVLWRGSLVLRRDGGEQRSISRGHHADSHRAASIAGAKRLPATIRAPIMAFGVQGLTRSRSPSVAGRFAEADCARFFCAQAGNKRRLTWLTETYRLRVLRIGRTRAECAAIAEGWRERFALRLSSSCHHQNQMGVRHAQT